MSSLGQVGFQFLHRIRLYTELRTPPLVWGRGQAGRFHFYEYVQINQNQCVFTKRKLNETLFRSDIKNIEV